MPRMRPSIHSIKHYIQQAATGIASGASTSFVIATAVAKGAARTATSSVEEGCSLKAIYVEVWATADNPNFTVHAVFYKRPAGVTAMTFAELASGLQSYANKRNVLEAHQGLAPAGDQVLPVFRQWFKIPKGKQRMGLDDQWEVKIGFSGSAGDICGISTYKEYE